MTRPGHGYPGGPIDLDVPPQRPASAGADTAVFDGTPDVQVFLPSCPVCDRYLVHDVERHQDWDRRLRRIRNDAFSTNIVIVRRAFAEMDEMYRALLAHGQAPVQGE